MLYLFAHGVLEECSIFKFNFTKWRRRSFQWNEFSLSSSTTCIKFLKLKPLNSMSPLPAPNCQFSAVYQRIPERVEARESCDALLTHTLFKFCTKQYGRVGEKNSLWGVGLELYQLWLSISRP